MLVKYVKNALIYTPEQIARMTKEVNYLQDLQSAIQSRIALLNDCITNNNQVSFIHVGTLLELDKELLAEEPECYCIKVCNNQSKKIEYLRKADIRK